MSSYRLSIELTLLKSKIHCATVTDASLDYLAQLVGLLDYEKILVSKLHNGARFETYAIHDKARRGIIELNGATACLGKIGDRITIMSFARLTPEEATIHGPRVLLLNQKNEIVRYDKATMWSRLILRAFSRKEEV